MVAMLILALAAIFGISAYVIETERIIGRKDARIESQRVVIQHQRAEIEQLTYLIKEQNQKDLKVS